MNTEIIISMSHAYVLHNGFLNSTTAVTVGTGTSYFTRIQIYRVTCSRGVSRAWNIYLDNICYNYDYYLVNYSILQINYAQVHFRKRKNEKMASFWHFCKSSCKNWIFHHYDEFLFHMLSIPSIYLV